MQVRVFAPPFADFSVIDEGGMVELSEASTLGDLLRLLRVPFRGLVVRLFMVNREGASLDTPLHDGDTVSFLPLLAGG